MSSFFATGKFNRVMYFKLLEEAIDPILTKILESGCHYTEDLLIRQQDRA